MKRDTSSFDIFKRLKSNFKTLHSQRRISKLPSSDIDIISNKDIEHDYDYSDNINQFTLFDPSSKKRSLSAINETVQ